MSELMHYTPRKGSHKYIGVKMVGGKPQYIYPSDRYRGTVGGRLSSGRNSSTNYAGTIGRKVGTANKSLGLTTPESYKDGSSMRRRYKASSTPEANKAGTGVKTNYAANRAKANGVNARNYKYNSEQMKSGSSAAHTPNYAPNKQTLAKRKGSQSNYSGNSEKFKSGTTITRSVGTAKENRHKHTDAATKNKKVTTGYQQYRTTPENMKSGSMAGRSANTNKKKKGLANKIANGWNSLKKKLGWR